MDLRIGTWSFKIPEEGDKYFETIRWVEDHHLEYDEDYYMTDANNYTVNIYVIFD